MYSRFRLALVSALVVSSSVSNPAGAGAAAAADASTYLLGLGIGDVTGPVVETNMMGYADGSQTSSGIHIRQRARAFIVAEQANPQNRILFINADVGLGDFAARDEVLNRLNAIYPGVYSISNTALVATHSHAGVGGYNNYLLPTLTSGGFVNQTFQSLVAGSVNAVVAAHKSLRAGKLSVGNTTLLNTNLNRSPYSYLNNPASERARYQYDQDKDFSLIKFTDSASNVARGFLSFFAVHGTSLYENNTLVSSDNKGMAAYLYESYAMPDSMPGLNNSFVAGFAQANVGDTSPNTLGAYCESPGKPWDGQPCEFQKSTCGNTTEDCHGRGPAFTEDAYGFGSNRVIGTNQFNAAKTLMESPSKPLGAVAGSVRALHTYVNMSNYAFTLKNGSSVTTCPAALGYGFAGGTTDGPGYFDFVQGTNSTGGHNPFWDIVKGVATPYPTPQQQACQYPKVILLNVGFAHLPYEWAPAIVDIQLFQIGNIVILVVPGEFTTMSGRRIRDAVRTQLIAQGVIGQNAYVLLAGPSNSYSHYIATPEEYAIQRYEGGSTLYGPHTLDAYINIYEGLVQYLKPGSKTLPAGPSPPVQTGKAISLGTPVIQDGAGFGSSFGKVLTDVSTSSSYSAGKTAFAVFQGANPRNNLHLEGTLLTVDRNVGGTWVTYKTDSHPSTTYHWVRDDTVLGTSHVNLTWTIENGTPAGSYRFTYYGDSKALLGGKITSFTGQSSTFTVA